MPSLEAIAKLTCDASTGDVETGESLRRADQPVYLSSRLVREPFMQG